MLIMPSNIEWLNIEIECKLDISKCNQLIGMNLNKPCAIYGTIRWPKDYLIPFVYFSNRTSESAPMPMTSSESSPQITLKDPYARFVGGINQGKESNNCGVKIKDVLLKLDNKTQDVTDESLVD